MLRDSGWEILGCRCSMTSLKSLGEVRLWSRLSEVGLGSHAGSRRGLMLVLVRCTLPCALRISWCCGGLLLAAARARSVHCGLTSSRAFGLRFRFPPGFHLCSSLLGSLLCTLLLLLRSLSLRCLGDDLESLATECFTVLALEIVDVKVSLRSAHLLVGFTMADDVLPSVARVALNELL